MHDCPRCHAPLQYVDDDRIKYVICPICNFLEVIDFQRKGIMLKDTQEEIASSAGEQLAKP